MQPSSRNFVLLVGLAAGALVHTSANARPVSIRGLAAQEVRLATIAYRIAEMNAQSCMTGEKITGLVLHDLTRYDREQRGAVAQSFALNSGVGVLGVVPGSIAAQSGLAVDDEIIAVGNQSVEDAASWTRPKSFNRIALFDRLLQAQLESGQTTLQVRRRGQIFQLSLPAKSGCGGKLVLSSSAVLNAWADGSHVIVTTGIDDMAQSDDEIAFVIAHEMAHNILHRPEAGHASGIFFGASGIRNGEIEADRFAVELMAKAGYQPAGGIAFLKNARKRLWWSFSLDHPGFGRRIATVTNAMKLAQSGRRPDPGYSNGLPMARSQSCVPDQIAAHSSSCEALFPKNRTPSDQAGLTGRSLSSSPEVITISETTASNGSRKGRPKKPRRA